jgi:hypothetical protein
VLAACSQEEPTPTPVPEPTVTPEPTPIPAAEAGHLIVEPGRTVGTISPYFFGSNYGPWIAVPVDMLPAAYDSQVQSIRFPGGAWGDRNDLKNYHIDPFIKFTEQVGAIATFNVRLRQGTPEQAAELLRYVNIEKAYGVEYWGIGNEPTLFAAELRQLGIAEDYDTEQFNREWREIALAMKEVDPTIKLLGPELHGTYTANFETNPKDSSGRDWMVEFLKANGDLVDVVTFHRYPFPQGEQLVTIDDLRQNAKEWTQTIPFVRDQIEEYTGRDLPIAITEINTHYNPAVGGETTPDSHYAAIWLSEVFGRMLYQDVFMVNHWLLTSSGGQGGWGIIGRGELRPAYYVYQLYSMFGTELVYTDSAVEDLSIYAARREDGRITILINNLADTEQTATLLAAGESAGTAEMWQMTADASPETAEEFTFSADGLITVPAQSISLFILGGG